MCYIVACRYYLRTKCFNNCKNISTAGEIMSKIKVASFFLGDWDTVYWRTLYISC